MATTHQLEPYKQAFDITGKPIVLRPDGSAERRSAFMCTTATTAEQLARAATIAYREGYEEALARVRNAIGV